MLIIVVGTLYTILTVIIVSIRYPVIPDDPIANKIQKSGLPLEVHDITTSDGYNLRLHRIPPKRHGKHKLKPPESVLMLHGLMASGAVYVMHPNDSMAIRLSKADYDIWILHARGISYSLKHNSTEARKSEYWNFSVHEVGYFDVPSAVDHVLKVSGARKLHFVGHSQGGTALAIALSTRPEYNEKIASAYLLAPAIFNSHTKGSHVLASIHSTAQLMGTKAMYLRDNMYESVSVSMHKSFFVNYPIIKFMDRIMGCNADLTNVYDYISWYISFIQNNGAQKQIKHFLQLLDSLEFKMFDYGADNIKQYGLSSPPNYNLSLVKIPVTLLSAERDELVYPEAVNLLETKLQNVRKNYMVPTNHLDFLFETKIMESIVADMIDSFKSANRNNNQTVKTDFSMENSNQL